MSFPSINVKANSADIPESLPVLLEQKLQTLDKFINEASSMCDAEFEKVADHQSGNVHRVEVNLSVNGKLFRAEATEDSFEKAVDEVRNELDKALRRSRKKEDTLLKRGGRKLKEMLRFGR